MNRKNSSAHHLGRKKGVQVQHPKLDDMPSFALIRTQIFEIFHLFKLRTNPISWA